MTSEKEVGLNLLRRLLAGERENLPMHLALLLEKSSPLHADDEHYRKILPVELADVRFSSDTAEKISSSLCAEVGRVAQAFSSRVHYNPKRVPRPCVVFKGGTRCRLY
jgi:hypothetical protein